MKKIEKILLAGFVMAVLFSFLGFTARFATVPEKVLRLHVLANSDSEYDQRIKLLVKDKVLAYAATLAAETESAQDAKAVVTAHLPALEETANQALASLGCTYRAQAKVETAYFGTRDYEGFSLPAGEYEALRILIGEAEGQNWWCVVYPSLCVSAAGDFSAFSPAQAELLQNPGEHKVSFQLYEWYQQVLQWLAP